MADVTSRTQCPYDVCYVTVDHSHGSDMRYTPSKAALADREEGCPRDTNGDGDCGQPACPDCGDGIPSPGTLDRALYEAFVAGVHQGDEHGLDRKTEAFREWRRSLSE